MKAENIKTLAKKIMSRRTRPILKQIKSDGTNLYFTDLETTVTIKNVNYPIGMIKTETLGVNNEVLDNDTSNFPLFNESVSVNNKLKVSVSNLELLLDSVSKDETRPNLCGIAWVKSDLVSTNGHILTLVEGNNINDHESSIFPKKSIESLLFLAKKFKMKEMLLSVDSMHFTIDTENFTLFGKLISRDYPRYQSIIPIKTENSIIIKNRVEVKTIKDILNRNKTVEIKSENGNLKLLVQGSTYDQVIGQGELKESFAFNLKYLNFMLDLDNKIMFDNGLRPFMVKKGNITRVGMPVRI
jgi:DNA polymerase III sliding clamp (beta) subunit (PCNA family)